jgi:hydrogenase expression/formation protein HypC
MCVAIPVRVLSVEGLLARVERGGEIVEVNLLLLDDDVRPGDYLVLQAGNHAIARMDAAEAMVRLALFEEVLASLSQERQEAAE